MKIHKIKEIRLFGKTYRIAYIKQGSNPDVLQGKLGMTSYNTQTIYLDEEVHNEQLIDSFFHEIFHVLNTEMRLGLEESQIIRFATGMTDFILNNSKKMVFTE